MAAQIKTRSSSQKLFNTLYFLNKSCTKKLLIGFDNIDIDPNNSKFEPIVNFVGPDYNGIRFTVATWEEFKQSFDDINRYFHGDNNLRDNRVFGTEWSVRFTTSHSDKAIEIEEDRRPSTSYPVIKKFRSSLVIKKVTFDELQKISVCVDKRLEYLGEITETVNVLVKNICDVLEDKCATIHDAQIDFYTENIVAYALNYFNDSDLQSLKNKVCVENDIIVKILNEFEFKTLYHEIVFMHTKKIVELLNIKLQLGYIKK